MEPRDEEPRDEEPKYEVVISLRDPLMGRQITTKTHPVADLHAAGVLVANIQECIERFDDYLPGLRVDVYELAETWRPTTRGEALLSFLADSAQAGEVRSARAWAEIFQGMPE